MPDLTVSVDIDSFMQSANKAAAVSFLGALTTAQIAGLSTTAPAALATAPVVGLSTFASPADHQHVFPTAAQVGALSTTDLAGLSTMAPAALATAPVVGLSQFAARADHRHVFPTAAEIGALTTSQIAGLSTMAPAALATSPVVGLSQFAARADHQHTSNIGTVYEYFEHFLSSTVPFLGNIAASNNGGTVTTASGAAIGTRLGVLQLSTGATAAIDQRAAINNAPASTQILSSGMDYYLAGSFARGSAAWPDGAPNAGAFRFGLLSAVTGLSGVAEPTSGVYFRAVNSANIDFVCRNAGTETVVSTGRSLANGTFNKYEILINTTGGTPTVTAKIDDSVVATVTTNLPASANRIGFGKMIQRATTDTSTYIMLLDWLYFRAVPITAWLIP